MDLLKKELERKKKALKGAASASGSRRFIPAGKLRQLQEEQDEAERNERSLMKRKKRFRMTENEPDVGDDSTFQTKKKKSSTNEQTSLQVTTGSETKPKEVVSPQQQTENRLSVFELTRELRQLGLPVRLFGESDTARRKRLQQAFQEKKETLATISEKEEFRLGQGHGIRNAYLAQDSQEENDGGVAKKPAAKTEAKKITKEESEEDARDPHKRIYRYFKDLLREWEDDLAKRPDAVRKSVTGRKETKTLKQCKDYIRPLFKLCKSRKLEEGLMANILKIIDFCQQGDFVKANDSYMDVAIGRAAWPIGVTMVGIHARTGRSKIESQNVAHVMNSELQRKYLTSVKRLMTYAQNKRTDVDPSKKVMN